MAAGAASAIRLARMPEPLRVGSRSIVLRVQGWSDATSGSGRSSHHGTGRRLDDVALAVEWLRAPEQVDRFGVDLVRDEEVHLSAGTVTIDSGTLSR